MESRYKVGDILIFPEGIVHHYKITSITNDQYKLKLIYSSDEFEMDYEDWSDKEWVDSSTGILMTPLYKALK